MLDSSLLRPAITNNSSVQYLLVMTQLLFVLITFTVTAECDAVTLIHTDICVSHMNSYSEHEHLHCQPTIAFLLVVGSAVVILMLVSALTFLVPTSIILDTIKPPPRFA